MAKGAGEKSPVLYSAVNLRYIQNEDQHTRPRRLTKFVCKQGYRTTWWGRLLPIWPCKSCLFGKTYAKKNSIDALKNTVILDIIII